MRMATKSRPRTRIDRLLVARGLVASREKAQAAILAGSVTAAGRRIDKAGDLVRDDVDVVLAARPRFVGRGGEKLDGLLGVLGIDVGAADALDVGASTGGFTDCLLQRGASSVVALDVGRGQLDWKLRTDPRVRVVEGVNARRLEPVDLPGPFDLIVVDVSFISLRLVLPALAPLLRRAGETFESSRARRDGRGEVGEPGREVRIPGSGSPPALPLIIPLVNPQFVVGRRSVGPGGIVRDPEKQIEAIVEVATGAERVGLATERIVESPIRGAEGNRVFFLVLRTGSRAEPDRLEAMARAVVLARAGDAGDRPGAPRSEDTDG